MVTFNATIDSYRRQMTGYTFISLFLNLGVLLFTTNVSYNVGAAFITLMIIITTLRTRRKVYNTLQREINKLITLCKSNLEYISSINYSGVENGDIAQGKSADEVTTIVRHNLKEARQIKSSVTKLTYGNGFVVMGLIMNIAFLMFQLTNIVAKG